MWSSSTFERTSQATACLPPILNKTDVLTCLQDAIKWQQAKKKQVYVRYGRLYDIEWFAEAIFDKDLGFEIKSVAYKDLLRHVDAMHHPDRRALFLLHRDQFLNSPATAPLTAAELDGPFPHKQVQEWFGRAPTPIGPYGPTEERAFSLCHVSLPSIDPMLLLLQKSRSSKRRTPNGRRNTRRVRRSVVTDARCPGLD